MLLLHRGGPARARDLALPVRAGQAAGGLALAHGPALSLSLSPALSLSLSLSLALAISLVRGAGPPPPSAELHHIGVAVTATVRTAVAVAGGGGGRRSPTTLLQALAGRGATRGPKLGIGAQLGVTGAQLGAAW